jgi:hypothetical protein
MINDQHGIAAVVQLCAVSNWLHGYNVIRLTAGEAAIAEVYTHLKFRGLLVKQHRSGTGLWLYVCI